MNDDTLLAKALEEHEAGKTIGIRWFRQHGAGYKRAKRLLSLFLQRAGEPGAFLRETGVDLNAYEVERLLVNKWGVPGAEQKQIKVWLSRREDSALEEIERSLKEHPPIKRINAEPKEGQLALLSLFDLHAGMLAWKHEVGESYDTEKAIERLLTASANLLQRIPSEVKRIIIPVGNDLFHADTHDHTTTAGTRVDVDSRWPKAFSEVVSALIRGPLAWAAEIAPVHVVIVPGNHDYQRAFYMGEVLRWYFEGRGLPLTVDNSPRLRKYILWQRVLLGLTHGAYVKPDALPLIMASEAPREWGEAVWREWLLGHYHRKRETRYLSTTEQGGVRLRVLPAMTSTDAWHYQMGFVGGKPEATLTIYAEDGPVADIYWRP